MGCSGSKSKQPSENAVKPFADVQHLTPTRERELRAGATSFRPKGEAENVEKSGKSRGSGAGSGEAGAGVVSHKKESTKSISPRIHGPPLAEETPIDDLFEEFDEPSPPSMDRKDLKAKERFEIGRSVETSPLARSDFKSGSKVTTVGSEAPVLPPKQFLRTFDFDNDIFRTANSSRRGEAGDHVGLGGTVGMRERGSSVTRSPFAPKRTLLSTEKEEKRPVSGPRQPISLLGGEEEDLMESILADLDAI